MQTSHKYIARPVALGLTAAFLAPTLAGCGSPQQAEAPTVQRNMNRPPAIGAPRAQQNTGMSGKQKMMLLAGAAALYYMYKKKQNAKGQAVQYYKSESTGGIYYRDPQTKKPIWVTAPRQAMQVPIEEAQEYSRYRGYNNQSTGQSFGGPENYGGQPTY